MVYLHQARGARTRIVAALAASVLAHAWLVHGYGDRERARPTAAGTPFQATLIATSVQQATPAPERFSDSLQRLETLAVPVPHVLPAAPAMAPVAARLGVDSERTVPAQTQVSALPQAQDPTYYSSRSLDVFPAQLTPLNLAVIRAATSEAGSARATLLINEAGAVNEVASVEGAPHATLEQAIRELFLAAKFSPARKDGRVVKSRVLVNLNY